MKTIDQDIIESLFELDRDTGGSLVNEMIESFRTEHPAQLSALVQHISNRNGPATAFQAHAMKSTFGNFGAIHLANVLGRIELAGKNSDWIAIEIASEEMRAELHSFLEDLLMIEQISKNESLGFKRFKKSA